MRSFRLRETPDAWITVRNQDRHPAHARCLAATAACACGNDASQRESAATSGAVDTQTAVTDQRDITNYKLSKDRVDKFYAAMRNIALAMKDMSPEQREKIDMNAVDSPSLDHYATSLEREPAVRRAIQQAGLTAREFAVLTMSIMQTGMASAILATQPNASADSLMREMKVNPDNLRFMRQHEAAIKAKQQAVAAEMKAAGAAQ